jgi:F-type H+-transporting ATPase subunit b
MAAQEHQQPPQPQGTTPGQETMDRAQQHGKPTEQLEQAAGEAAADDPHAEFKESPSVKWLARTLGISLPAAYWVSVSLNFVVLAAIAWFILRKVKVGDSMRERTAAIRRQMEEAQRASEEAARRMRDIEARLASLDTEIAGLRSQAEQEGVREEERLLAAAAEEKRKIVAGAEQEIIAAAKSARADLRAYAAELAVGLAEKKIQVSESTDQTLVREFVDQLGKGR